jgi:hypothetical protein
MSLAQEHLADLGQELLSAVTLRIPVAVHQRNAHHLNRMMGRSGRIEGQR